MRDFQFQLDRYRVAQVLFCHLATPSSFDGLQFAGETSRQQPLPPTIVVGFRSEAGVAKDRSPAANIDADWALIVSKKCQSPTWKPATQALEVARVEIGGLAVERAVFINDLERRQNPVLLDIVEFDGFIWESD